MQDQVAQTILDQIGHVALRMIGARNLVALEDGGLQFNIGRNSKKVNKIVIKLTADDLYDVTYWNIRGVDCRKIEFVEGIYADMLNTSIERVTGMFTSL